VVKKLSPQRAQGKTIHKIYFRASLLPQPELAILNGDLCMIE